VSGIEPAEAAAAHAGDLGLNVVCGLLSEATLKLLAPWMSSSSSNVIEHLPDPQEASRCARTISGRTESSC